MKGQYLSTCGGCSARRRLAQWRVNDPGELARAMQVDKPPAEPDPKAEQAASPQAATPQRKLDRSGKKRVGKASYYARKFAGRKMADGTPHST